MDGRAGEVKPTHRRLTPTHVHSSGVRPEFVCRFSLKGFQAVYLEWRRLDAKYGRFTLVSNLTFGISMPSAKGKKESYLMRSLCTYPLGQGLTFDLTFSVSIVVLSVKICRL